MPTYDYRCDINDRVVEVSHRMSETIANWGDLCARAGVELGGPAAAPPPPPPPPGGTLIPKSRGGGGGPPPPACGAGGCCPSGMCGF